MYVEPTNDRKLKPTEAPEQAVKSNTAESSPLDTRQRRLSTEAESSVSSTHATAPTPVKSNTAESSPLDTRHRCVSMEAQSSVSSTHATGAPTSGNHSIAASIASISQGTVAAPNDRKRKPTEAPELVVNSNTAESSPRDTQLRRVSMEAQSTLSSTHAIDPTPGNRSTAASIASISRGTIATPYGSVEGIGNLIQALTCSNGAVVDAALDSLYRYSKRDFDSLSWAKIAAVGGCFALVQLMKKSLQTAIEIILLHNFHLQVPTGRLSKVFIIISNMTHGYPLSIYGINSIGGVEVLVKVMKTFPNHPWVQLRACNALCNLTACPVGRERADDVGAIEILLKTIKNYPGNKYIFLYGCRALTNMCTSSFERTKQLIDLGGITKWPDDPEARAVAKGLLKVKTAGIQQLLNAD